VTALGQLGLDAQVQVLGALSEEGTLASVLDLRGAAACATNQTSRAEGVIPWHGLAIGRSAAIGSAVYGLGFAIVAERMTTIHGAGQSVLAVTRTSAGDADVLGDSAHLIGFGVAALARTGSIGKTSDFVVGLAGSAAARVTTQRQFADAAGLAGDTQTDVAVVATGSGLIDCTTAASAKASRSARGQGTLSLAGAGLARSAAVGTATASALAIDGALAGATGLAGDLRSDLVPEGTASSMLDAMAQTAGQFDVARSSAADVQIGADARHGMPLIGVAGGTAHVQVARSIGTARLEITSQVRALNMTSAASGSVLTAQRQITGQASLHGTSKGNVSVTRLARGDLLVVGSASRAMVYLGGAQARAITQAAANLPLEPGFAGAGTNVTRVDFHSQEAFSGRGTTLSTAQAVARGSEFELWATAVAYSAPPARGRSGSPRIGLSGRLIPSNTGRILKG